MENVDLFGFPLMEPNRPAVNKSAIQMHKDLTLLHGSYPGKCKDCVHFKVKQFSNRYFKCDLASMSSNPKTDWRANWQACGKFELKP